MCIYGIGYEWIVDNETLTRNVFNERYFAANEMLANIGNKAIHFKLVLDGELTEIKDNFFTIKSKNGRITINVYEVDFINATKKE